MIKILIADDQELIRDSLRIVLSANPDFSVDTAANGTEVVRAVRQNKPDVILMDIRMPEMDGVQCTKIIKENYPEIKIIILTTFDDDEYIFSALKHGASGYLLKGISADQLIEAIHKVYHGNAMINEDIAGKVVKMFSQLAKENAAVITVDEDYIKEITESEWKVIGLVSKGLSNKEIAALAAVAAALYFFQNKRTITLGFFTGSAWDVPDAYTYQIIDDAVNKFEINHPGVKVKFVSGIQKDDYSEYIASALVKGNAPDVFFVLPEDFSTLAGTDALMKLDGYIDRDADYDKSRYYNASFAFGNISGSQYGIPFESVPSMMFVNKTLLKNEGISEIPETWTWKDFYEICDRVSRDTDGNGIEDQFGVCGYTWQHASACHEFQDRQGGARLGADKNLLL